MIYHFHSKEIPSLAQVGGKAKALIETTQAGFNVPEGFVLAVDFFQVWTDEIKATDVWRAFLQEPGREACVALQKRAKQFRFTPEQHAAIEQELAQMHKNVVFAVRSSSPEEDLAQTSFAGQYETMLGVRLPKLEESIAEAFSSMLDFRVVEYKRQNQLPVDNPRIAIIVQKQIKSDVSGIAFSLNPNNNAFDEAMINASFGLGEAIVSGQVTPDTYVVEKVKKAILEKKIAHKLLGIWLQEDGGTVEKPNPAPEAQALTAAQIFEVAALATDCEEHYGKPMDIEWAIESGKLYLLQTRPITTYNPLFPEMLTQPGERKNIYLDLIILTQGFFEPISVLGLDIWSRMLGVAKLGTLPQGKDGYFFNVGGREYLHISNMAKGMGKRLFSMIQTYELPIREVFKSLDLENEYITLVKTEKIKQAGRDTLSSLISLTPRMIGGMLNPQQASTIYEQDIANTYRYYTQEMLKEGTFSEIVDRGIEKFGYLCKEYLRVAVSGELSMKGLKKMFKGQDVDDLVALLGTASSTNPTAQMGLRMLELASFAELQDTATEDEFIQKLLHGGYSAAFMEAYQDYMERFGARGLREIDVATPRTSEDARAFFQQLKSMNVDHNNVLTLQERKSTAYQQLLVLAQKLGKEKQFINHAQKLKFLGYRETPKDLLVVMIGEIRKRALELGRRFVSQGRLKSPEQVFDLTIVQVTEADTNPGCDLQPLREKNLEPRKAVAHIKDKDWPKIVNSRGKIFRYARPSGVGDLTGEPISSGTVRGKAKVLGSPFEKPLGKGEILVTRATEPSWTPIFMNAAGVVLEIGGPLQHGAIIAREYGIPCVSGIDDATKLIKDGDLLEVDGTGGLVKIIKDAWLLTKDAA
jgi:phosphohistidine swiveling domain-containing protein